MNKDRIRKLNAVSQGENTGVLYWMDRERRVQDNWALIAAYKTAEAHSVPLHVLYVIPQNFYDANIRTYDFMLKGLKESAKELFDINIHFHMHVGDVSSNVVEFVEKNQISTVFTDLASLRLPRQWRDDLKADLKVPFFEVDARNVIPVYITSDKKEFSARTIRPKIHKNLNKFLDKFPVLKKFEFNKGVKLNNFKIDEIIQSIPMDMSIPSQNKYKPGTKAALKVLNEFIDFKLNNYDELRNDPNKDFVSDLSPYLHFGQISSQTICLALNNIKNSQAKDVFIEELVVRRELAENFCYYEPNYDNFQGFHNWAQTTLNEHKADERDHLYSLYDFENANTHEPLWNAAQIQMVKTGKMHGFLRMYWAKKILEWTDSPEKALDIANYLNNKYELDGRDPNGYTGTAWSIGGVHDRAWFERPVFGKIRYMNFNGCKRKFDVNLFINKYKKTP